MYLCITIRFLDGRYHGRGDGEESEWPPSPWRLFQALLAGAKTEWSTACAASFRWLEALSPPVVHAAVVAAPVATSGVLTYVPNNSPGHGRSAKLIQPRVLPDHARHVSYFWRIGNDPIDRSHAEIMAAVARHIRCVGWGIDLAIGHGQLLTDLPFPGDTRVALNAACSRDFGGDLLRVPCAGSLTSLEKAHDVAMNRLRYNPVTKTVEVHDQPGLARFERRAYGQAVARPFCAFDLCQPPDPAHPNEDSDDAHKSFDPRQLKVLVGMVRGLLGSDRVRQGLRDFGNDDWVNAVLLGHPRDTAGARLSILPLLSVGHIHADGRARRLILAEPDAGSGDLCRRLAELLNGQLLKPEAAHALPVARLVRLRGDDRFLRQYYVGSAKSWATVSPVILPGFDARTDRRRTQRHLPAPQQLDRAEKLVLKSLEHAGITNRPTVELSPISWWSGVPAATQFVTRDKLGPCPRYHLKLTFAQSVAGPLSLGRQRHAGLGVFAAIG